MIYYLDILFNGGIVYQQKVKLGIVTYYLSKSKRTNPEKPREKRSEMCWPAWHQQEKHELEKGNLDSTGHPLWATIWEATIVSSEWQVGVSTYSNSMYVCTYYDAKGVVTTYEKELVRVSLY